MAFVAHDAEMARAGPEGIATWELSASRGNTDAAEKLRPRSFPEPLRYLYDWWGDLNAGRPDGVNGGRLTWEGLDAWARRTKTSIQPHEARGLFSVDSAWRSAWAPEPAEKQTEKPVAITSAKSPWPTRSAE